MLWGGGVVQGMLVSMCDSYAKQFTFVVLLICYNNTGHSSFSNYFQLNSRERKQIELTPELFKKYLKSMYLHTQQCHGGTQLFIKEIWINCCWFVYDLKWSLLHKMFCSKKRVAKFRFQLFACFHYFIHLFKHPFRIKSKWYRICIILLIPD